MARIEKLLPAMGFIIAVALVCVTSAFKDASKGKNDATLLTFQYNAPGGTDFSQSSVENLANWSYTSDDSRCSDQSAKACKVYASQTYVDGADSSNYALDPSYVITASNGSISHVTATSDGNSSTYITNKGN